MGREGDEREGRGGEERGGDFAILPPYLNFLATPLIGTSDFAWKFGC